MAKHDKVDLPLQWRLARIASADETLPPRTRKVTWSTGAPVLRYDWWDDQYYNETLDLSPEAVDLTRMNTGAPLLDSHMSDSVSRIMGVVVPGSATVDGSEGTCLVQFSQRADVEPFYQDVVDGIIQNISVGYWVGEYTVVSQQGQIDEYRATLWTPGEISMCAVQADAGAGFRSQPPTDAQKARSHPCALKRSNPTTETHMKTPAEIAEEQRVAAEAETARQAETTRLAGEAETRRLAGVSKPTTGELRTLALALSHRGSDVDSFIARGIEAGERGESMEQIRTAAINAAAEKQRKDQPIDGITITRDAMETRRAGIAEYILHRGNPGKVKLDKGAQFRGMSFSEIARECVETAGISTRGMSKMEIATHALNMDRTGINVRSAGEGISDLPNIVLDAANKTLRQAYGEQLQTFRAFARQATASDFKTINRIMMSNGPGLLAVTENGEIQRGYVGDSKESYALSTFARIIPLTRQLIINDDMDALSRLPEAMGRSAARLESDTVWAQITSNPIMADGNAVFSAAHNNLATTPAPISATSVGLGVTAMGIQTGLQGETLNLSPEYLVGPKALDIVLRQMTSDRFVPTKQSDQNPYVYLKPIAEARLDKSSTTSWYEIAGNDQVDTVEFSYLEGQEGVYMETRLGFEVDGMEMKARLDFAAKVIDFRGMYKNAGQ